MSRSLKICAQVKSGTISCCFILYFCLCAIGLNALREYAPEYAPEYPRGQYPSDVLQFLELRVFETNT